MTGGVNPTGTVTFDLFPPGDTTCTGTPVFTPPTRSAGARCATSGPFTTTAVGTYRWVASYNGDANNAPVSSGCADEPVTTTPGHPDDRHHRFGRSSGRRLDQRHGDRDRWFNPTGTVTFNLFPPSDTTCSGTPAFISTRPAVESARATSGSFTTTAVGTYRWVATYDGDTNNAAVSSGCTDEPVTTTQATPAISTTPSAGGPVGTSISDTATVTGGFNPTGTVTFELFPPGNTTCTAPSVFTSTNPLTGGSATSGSFVDRGGGHLPLGGHLQR